MAGRHAWLTAKKKKETKQKRWSEDAKDPKGSGTHFGGVTAQKRPGGNAQPGIVAGMREEHRTHGRTDSLYGLLGRTAVPLLACSVQAAAQLALRFWSAYTEGVNGRGGQA